MHTHGSGCKWAREWAEWYKRNINNCHRKKFSTVTEEIVGSIEYVCDWEEERGRTETGLICLRLFFSLQWWAYSCTCCIFFLYILFCPGNNIKGMHPVPFRSVPPCMYFFNKHFFSKQLVKYDFEPSIVGERKECSVLMITEEKRWISLICYIRLEDLSSPNFGGEYWLRQEEDTIYHFNNRRTKKSGLFFWLSRVFWLGPVQKSIFFIMRLK